MLPVHVDTHRAIGPCVALCASLRSLADSYATTQKIPRRGLLALAGDLRRPAQFGDAGSALEGLIASIRSSRGLRDRAGDL